MVNNSLKAWKKKRMKRSVRLAIASIMLCCIALVPSQLALASASKITYDGSQKKILFENVKGSDLFGGMKGVMPGDVRKETISLKAKPVDREATIYLRAECDDKTEEILKDITMELKKDGKTIVQDGLVFDDVKLATLGKNEETSLELQMHFPVTLGNEVAGKEFHIKWILTVQEDGKEIVETTIPEEDDGIKTGDGATPLFYILLGVLSVSVIGSQMRKKIKE